MNNHLFLFGGSPPFTPNLAKRFSELTLEKEGKVSFLVLERDSWQEYMPLYTKLLEEFGVTRFIYIPLPTIPVEEAVSLIAKSSGIIIGGGNTNLYADLIVDTKISEILKKCYRLGVPVAGFSAGALISMDPCIISAKDNTEEVFQHRRGLGLLKDTVLAVHFSEWQDDRHLLQAVEKFHPVRNYGIDEQTGMYLYNNKLMEIEGKGLYSVEEKRVIKKV